MKAGLFSSLRKSANGGYPDRLYLRGTRTDQKIIPDQSFAGVSPDMA